MGEVTISTFLTLDGVMQAPGGPEEDPQGGFPYGGWLVPHFDAETGEKMDEVFQKVDAFLLGRTTYEIFASHWPKVDDPNDPVASKLNALPKFVATRTLDRLEWGPATAVRDAAREVAALKDRFEGELQVHGSAGLAQTLIEHDLIDEYRLITFPVVLGTGKRLFGPGAVPATLKLVDARTTSKGAVISTYRRGGAFETGSFALT